MEYYKRFSRSFIQIPAKDVRDAVEAACRSGGCWLAVLRVLGLIYTSHSMSPWLCV
jgi:hypothetical protein